MKTNFYVSLLLILSSSLLSAMTAEKLKENGISLISVKPTDPRALQQIKEKENEWLLLKMNEVNALYNKEILKTRNPNSKEYKIAFLECHLCKKLVDAKQQEIETLFTFVPIDSAQGQQELNKLNLKLLEQSS